MLIQFIADQYWTSTDICQSVQGDFIVWDERRWTLRGEKVGGEQWIEYERNTYPIKTWQSLKVSGSYKCLTEPFFIFRESGYDLLFCSALSSVLYFSHPRLKLDWRNTCLFNFSIFSRCSTARLVGLSSVGASRDKFKNFEACCLVFFVNFFFSVFLQWLLS